jgi:hypothetical protein
MLVRRLSQITRTFGGSHGEVAEHHHEYDVNYYYNKYGPFHTYTHLNHGRIDDTHNTEEEDPYRNEVHGYIKFFDYKDHRNNFSRGVMEALYGGMFLFGFLSVFSVRFDYDLGYEDRVIGDALVTA